MSTVTDHPEHEKLKYNEPPESLEGDKCSFLKENNVLPMK
jgi:hypothetical protein